MTFIGIYRLFSLLFQSICIMQMRFDILSLLNEYDNDESYSTILGTLCMCSVTFAMFQLSMVIFCHHHHHGHHETVYTNYLRHQVGGAHFILRVLTAVRGLYVYSRVKF